MVLQVFVIAPHPDDETIGCGGAILHHRRQADQVCCVFLTSGERGLPGLPADAVWAIREQEARCAARVLDVTELHFLRLPDQGLADHIGSAARQLQALWANDAPDVIYAPHPADAHPDHAVALAIVEAAGRKRGRVRLYEIWTPLSAPTRSENISDVMPAKLRALRCYRSQLALVRYDHAVRGLNRYRGVMQGGCRYAEVFAEREPPPDQ